jgi:hypothetical protein
LKKSFFGCYELFIQWGEDMTKSMHPLTRGKDHGEGQSAQKEPHCVSSDGSWGVVRDVGVKVMCTFSNMESTIEEGRGQCVSGITKTITMGL